jgi:hypothetical protein
MKTIEFVPNDLFKKIFFLASPNHVLYFFEKDLRFFYQGILTTQIEFSKIFIYSPYIIRPSSSTLNNFMTFVIFVIFMTFVTFITFVIFVL